MARFRPQILETNRILFPAHNTLFGAQSPGSRFRRLWFFYWVQLAAAHIVKKGDSGPPALFEAPIGSFQIYVLPYIYIY